MQEHIQQLVIAGQTKQDAYFPMSQLDPNKFLFDPVESGFCTLEKIEGSYIYKISEPLSLELLQEIMRAKGAQISYDNKVRELMRCIQLDPKAKYKGNLFESAIAAYIAYTWHGKTFAELPFLAPYRDKLPSWCSRATISWSQFAQSDIVQEPNDFGASSSDIFEKYMFPYYFLYLIILIYELSFEYAINPASARSSKYTP